MYANFKLKLNPSSGFNSTNFRLFLFIENHLNSGISIPLKHRASMLQAN